MKLIRINKNILFLVIIFICLLCCIGLFFHKNYYGLASAFYQQNNEIDVNMEFNVKYIIEKMDGASGHMPLNDGSYVSIKNARIILINDITGEIIKSGITDVNGEWKTNITVSRDLRFKQKNMSTITVITVADGFNETIHFNVSVNEHAPYTSGDYIILYPINPNGRNEPSFDTIHFHRFTVFEMLNDYAKVMGLERQPIIQEGEIPPWGPRLKSK